MLNKNTLLKIKQLAFKIDHDLAFAGKSKGNKHLHRVVRIAEFMAIKSSANISTVLAGASLHDTALPSGNDYNYDNNKKIVKGLLKNLGLSAEELESIAECVASHEGTTRPMTLEAKIVHDADVLEKTGLLGIIRHTWKLTNLGIIDYKNITDEDVKTVIDHLKWRKKKLQTPLAKKMEKYLSIPINQQKIKTIITLTSKQAFAGVITEKIALSLKKVLNEKENSKLKEQLSLSYLNLF